MSSGQGYDIKIAGKKARARVDSVQYRVDINNLTQRSIEALPLNGIGLVNLTFDRLLMLDTYQQNPVTGRLIIIDCLTNVTVSVGLMYEPTVREFVTVSQFSVFELEPDALIRRCSPYRGTRDLLGGK